jgi:hypothetical protein
MILSVTKKSVCLWPSLIAQLDGLEDFKFSRPFDSPDVRITGHQLSTLSRNLKSLELEVASGICSFHDLCNSHPSHFHNLKTLSFVDWSDVGLIEFEIPPTLTFLNVQALYLALPISQLPPALTRLKCSVNTLQNGDSKFPDNLTSVTVTARNWLVPLEALPSHLEHLEIHDDSRGVNIDNWSGLARLKNLKFLECPVNGLFDVEKALMIPRSVESLKLPHIKNDPTAEWSIGILKALPQNIRQLDGIWPDKITAAIAQSMPRTLSRISNLRVLPEAVSFLPDACHEFELLPNGEDPHSLISAFPSKLSSLYLTRLSPSLAEKFPTHLKSIVILSTDEMLSTEVLQNLPRNLTSLQQFASFPEHSDLDQVFKALPPSLIELAVPPARMFNLLAPSSSSRYLPRTLKTIEMGCLDFSNSNMAEWILGLPKTLECMKIWINRPQQGAFTSFKHLTSLTRLQIAVRDKPEGGWARHLDFPSLPRSLTFLRIFSGPHAGDSDISDETLMGAPPLLTTIQLPASPLLTKECLVHLPKVSDFTAGIDWSPPAWFKIALKERSATS